MKFIVSSSYLLKQLSIINGVITTNPVVPILENFLFEISEGTLTITTSDLQTSMITEFQVEAKENGSIAIPAKILLETLKNLPEQPITFSIDSDTYGIEINSDNGRYKIAGENATDFPKIQTVSDAYSVNISSDVLGKAINTTIFATSNDDLRPAMTGVYIQLDKTNTIFVSTDSHKLIRYSRADVVSEMKHHMIIPRKALMLLKTTLPTESVNVNFEFNASNAFFQFNQVKMICRLIDERFPDYENVIPLDNNNIVKIDKHELLSSLKRIVIYANKTTYQTRLKIKGSELMVSAEDIDFSKEAVERLSCVHEGEDLEIGFNAKFLVEMLNNILSDEISLKLSAPNKAGIIIPSDKDNEEDLLMLVMPVMLNSQV